MVEVKKYYRMATKEDFVNDHELPQEVESMLNNGEIREAITYLYTNYSNTMAISRKRCRAYLAYKRAKKDFINGKMVFVEYE